MFRVFLVIAIFIGLVLVIGAVANAAKSVTASAQTALGENMPKSFQRIAYVMLILLMFGVVTGWLGGL